MRAGEIGWGLSPNGCRHGSAATLRADTGAPGEIDGLLWSREADDALVHLRELHHDLRQPLAAIEALAAAAAIGDVPQEVLECLDRIREEARSMLELCRHVLDVPAGEQPVAVDHLVREVVDEASATAACRFEVDAASAVLVSAPAELRRVLQNLIANAVRAAGPRGIVEVTVSDDGERIRVEVADSGPGFGRGPRGAAGIGMGIVERFVRTHGGVVEIVDGRLGGASVRLAFLSERSS